MDTTNTQTEINTSQGKLGVTVATRMPTSEVSVAEGVQIKRQPKCQGTYFAKDESGAVHEVEVIIVPDGKKKIPCVFEFGGKDVHVPAVETGLDFYFLVNRKGPLDNAGVESH